MESANGVIMLLQPEFGYLEGSCSWGSRRCVIGTFRGGETAPVVMERDRYMVVVFD